jgi:SH2 domain/CBL proto-oncogene N-terminus, EF hand-like domain
VCSMRPTWAKNRCAQCTELADTSPLSVRGHRSWPAAVCQLRRSSERERERFFSRIVMEMLHDDGEAQKFWAACLTSTSTNSCTWSSFVSMCEACAEQNITLPVDRVLQQTLQLSTPDTVTLNEFIVFIKRFGPFKACLTKASAVCDTAGQLAPWYHGAASREECYKRLCTAGVVGSFLVRYSSSRLDCFNVMVQQGAAVIDSLLKNSGAAGYCHDDRRDVRDSWATLADFVQHYQEEGWLTRPLPPTSKPDCNEEMLAAAAAAAAAVPPSLADLPEVGPLSRLRVSSRRLLVTEDTPESLLQRAEVAAERANEEGLSSEQRDTHRAEALQLVQSVLDTIEVAGVSKVDPLLQCKALGLQGGLLLSSNRHSEAVGPYKQALAVLSKHVQALEQKDDPEMCDDHSTHAFKLHAELTNCYLASESSEDREIALQHYAEMMASVPHTECRLRHARSWRQNNQTFADVVQCVRIERIDVSAAHFTILEVYHVLLLLS